jgi:Cu(I)/Ag(I) efflux system membrane fusion protein
MQKEDSDYAGDQSESLIKAAKRKLLLLGMSDAEIDELAKQGKVQQNLYLPGKDDKNVWVYITVYEYEVEFIKTGLPVEVETPAYPGKTFEGTIISVAPILDPVTRSFKVRALVNNPENKLKLEMFVNVRIKYDLGEKLAVPEDAVMYTGTTNIVFIAMPDGYFEPRTVKLGAKAQGYYEVLDGLKANEDVVTSGNFLVDSESKLNAVLSQMADANR